MKARAITALAAIFAVLALTGFTWGLWENKEAAARSFEQRRIELLESENQRLRAVVAEHEKARTKAENLVQRADIERAISSIRQLPFQKPVTYDVLTRADIQKVIERKMAEQFSDEEIANMATGLSALGLLPRDYPLKKKYIELLGEQVAAFYDQHQHKLFMFEDAALANAQNRIVLAHELTHALQDQHFGLLNLPLELKNNDDRAEAAAALIEGDATLAMSQFMIQNLSLKTLRDSLAGTLTQNMEQLRTAPRFLREMLIFPYLRGQEFCSALYARGGWAAISAAYKNPPSSTTQILHPEKYLSEPREEPVAIEWSDTNVNGEKPLADNVLGELGTRILLSEWLNPKTAEAAADGWRGDRYLVFNKGEALIWKTQWSSGRDAQEFSETLMAAMHVRFKGETAMQQAWTVISPVRNEVVYIQAPAAKWMETLREKFAQEPAK